jgi:hypothetical protein
MFPLSPLPTRLEANARGFLVLLYTVIWRPSTIYCHLNLLHSPSPSHYYLPLTLCLFYSPGFCWCSKGSLHGCHCESAFLWSVQPLPLLSLPLYWSTSWTALQSFICCAQSSTAEAIMAPPALLPPILDPIPFLLPSRARTRVLQVGCLSGDGDRL